MEKYIYKGNPHTDCDTYGDTREVIISENEKFTEFCIKSSDSKGGGEWVRLGEIITLKKSETNWIVPTETAFTCTICGDSQPCNYFAPIYFPVCDQCKKDLKEYVLSVRKK